MSESSPSTPSESELRRTFVGPDLTQLRQNWFLFLIIGILLVIFGTFAILVPHIFSEAFAVLLGVLVLLSGIIEIASVFYARSWGNALLEVLLGLFYIVVGVMIIRHTVFTLQVLTLVIAVIILVGGFFRIFAAIQLRYGGWGWTILSGVLGVLLGIIILAGYPWSSLWVIGLFIGIEILFTGWSWIMIALAARSLPAPPEESAASSEG